MIHVCSLLRLHSTVKKTGARHVVTLLGVDDEIERPPGVSERNHLFLRMHDISEPLEGHVVPHADHVESLVTFVRGWDREAPLVVHCWAGISRSTAAAFVSVCALNPQRDEGDVAWAIRRASPTATPNIRIVTLADAMLGRQGRMVAAVEAIGRGESAGEGVPFRLDLA
ncbi:MAG TPA: protein-tyrosine phosphatase family protein [Xanthobacteraceae bacterium]